MGVPACRLRGGGRSPLGSLFARPFAAYIAVETKHVCFYWAARSAASPHPPGSARDGGKTFLMVNCKWLMINGLAGYLHRLLRSLADVKMWGYEDVGLLHPRYTTNYQQQTTN